MTEHRAPSSAEQRFLRCVYKYWMTNGGSFPDSSELQEPLSLGKGGVSNLKRRLTEKGFLVNKRNPVELNEKGLQYCQSSLAVIVPLHVKLLGSVRASKTDDNTTEAVLEEDLPSERFETIAIPGQTTSNDVFALRVIGARVVVSEKLILVVR